MTCGPLVTCRRTQLTVKIAEKDVNNTMAILRAIPKEDIERKQEAISKVWVLPVDNAAAVAGGASDPDG